MGKLTELTDAQIKRIPEWVAKWAAIGLSTEPANFDAAEQAARICYAVAKLKPPRVVLRMSSPYGAVMGGVLAEELLKLGGEKISQVQQQVEQQVGQQVRQQVGQQVRLRWRDARGGNLWASWYAYISFFRDVCGWEDDSLAPYSHDEVLAQSASWTWWAPDVLAISDRPEIMHMDDRGRLHSLTEAALKYRDGWCIHAIHGVRVEPWIVENPERITKAIIDAEQNAEVRRVMTERYGYARYLKDSGADLVHELPDNYFVKGLQGAKLFRKSRPDDTDIVMLDVLNSTPEPDGSIKRYAMRIDGRMYDGKAATDCQAAMASTWRDPKDLTKPYFSKPGDYRPAIES